MIDRYIECQLKRASISMVINIAEGSEKSSKKAQINFFSISRASAYECVSLLEILTNLDFISNEQATLLLSQFEEVSKMLYGLTKSLRNS